MTLAEYPLHRLNSGQCRAWLMIPAMRRQLAEWMGKNYKTGCVVLSPELRAFAKVSPSGRIASLPWPWKKFLFHQIANKPSALYRECACRNFWDPESGGAWGERDRERNLDIHHWACQGREVAIKTYELVFKEATSRVDEGKIPEPRPDAWERKAKELEGKL